MNDDELYEKIEAWLKKIDESPIYNWKYEIEHPLFDELHTAVLYIMAERGPDGHTDGSNLITAWILENFAVTHKPRTEVK